MPLKVTLEITNGPLAGQKFEFSAPARCSLGRGAENTIRIPEAYSGVSRNHCVLDIQPDQIHIEDLNSLNGTYLGRECIGRRNHTQPQPVKLHDPAEVRLGGSPNSPESYLSLRISREVESPRTCAVCGLDVPITSTAPQHDHVVCPACRQDPAALLRHLEAGVETFAHYELLQKIGRGGFGSVYLARHRSTGRRVALKVMLPHIAHDTAMRQIFEREIENMKALRHPHVVELFEEGREGQSAYFAMEFCDLGSVSSFVKGRGGALPVDEALGLIFQTIDGLHYAHHATIPKVRLADGAFGSGTGLVHRDIKPCNLLLHRSHGEMRLKIGDFGMSKAWDQAGYSGVTRPGTRAGSFAYQPRHQLRGYREAQPEVDVWATAATLYFMLVGTPPRDFPRGTAPELVVLQNPVVKIRSRNSALPRRLAQVIDTVLDDETDLAVKSMAQLKRELEAAV